MFGNYLKSLDVSHFWLLLGLTGIFFWSLPRLAGVSDENISQHIEIKTISDISSPLLRGPLDLNRASASEFAALPGIGPKLAEEIVRSRGRTGVFHSVDELLSVRGIGPKKVEKLRPLVVVSSNTAR